MSVSPVPSSAVVTITTGSPRANITGEAARGLAHSDPAGQLFLDALLSVGEALGAKDAYTRSHSRRVREYAAAIGRELGLGTAELRDVRLAGQLHDVGKIGVPDRLLSKTGPLTDEEYADLMQHTLIGEQILRPLLHDNTTVLAAIRWHHERFDGTGLPDGLSGRQIPLVARIVAVADAFDAMTSERPYRSPLDLRAVVDELKRGVGSQFDPQCVTAFLQVLDRALDLAAAQLSTRVIRRPRARAPVRVRPGTRPSPRRSIRRGARARCPIQPPPRRGGLALVGARAPPRGLPASRSAPPPSPPTQEAPGRRAFACPQVPF